MHLRLCFGHGQILLLLFATRFVFGHLTLSSAVAPTQLHMRSISFDFTKVTTTFSLILEKRFDNWHIYVILGSSCFRMLTRAGSTGTAQR